MAYEDKNYRGKKVFVLNKKPNDDKWRIMRRLAGVDSFKIWMKWLSGDNLNPNIIFLFNYRHCMSSDTEKEKLEADEKKKRRTRKDGEGRDFVCPCGKSYLSYPALYTHIKTKHGGRVSLTSMKPPSGTPNGVRL